MKVLFDRVLVRPLKETVTASGIIIPDIATGGDKDLPNQGTIVSVGEDCKSSVEAGDVVLFNRFPPFTITVDGEDLLIFKESEIFLITKKAK